MNKSTELLTSDFLFLWAVEDKLGGFFVVRELIKKPFPQQNDANYMHFVRMLPPVNHFMLTIIGEIICNPILNMSRFRIFLLIENKCMIMLCK